MKLIQRSFILRLFIMGCLASSLAFSALAADTQQERVLWLMDQLVIATTVKAGTTSEKLLELFMPERGVTHGADGKHAWTFWLKSCRVLKVDVQFEENIISAYDVQPRYKIKWISKPYLARENIG